MTCVRSYPQVGSWIASPHAQRQGLFAIPRRCVITSDRLHEVTRLLHLADSHTDPNPGRDHITGLDHALRVAALGSKVSDELAFVGLVHDLARPLSDVHHGEVIAEVVRDRVSEAAYQVLRTHGHYQAALLHDTPIPDEPWTHSAVQLAAFEAASFAAGYARPELDVDQAHELLERWLG